MPRTVLGKVRFDVKGDYNPEAQYEELDVVFYQYSLYIVKPGVTPTIGTLPTDEIYFLKFADLDRKSTRLNSSH